MKKVLSLIILVFVVGLFVFPVIVSAVVCTPPCASGFTCKGFSGPPVAVGETVNDSGICIDSGTTVGKTGGTTGGGAAVKIENPLGANVSIDKLIENFIKSVLGLSGVLALVAFVYGGMFWLVSMGDPAKITKGKNIMIWAVFGLAVIFGSYAIITVVYNALGIK